MKKVKWTLKSIKLTGGLRSELKQYLANSRRDTMFGDGQEEEMIWDGACINGLNEMTDEELVDELRESIGYCVEDEEQLKRDNQLFRRIDNYLIKNQMYRGIQ